MVSQMPSPIFSERRYIEYRPGNLNLILTIPHGGRLRPCHIPCRDAGGYINGTLTYTHDVVKDHQTGSVRYRKDRYTQELGLLISDKVFEITGRHPHVILCHLYRGKLDVNCDIEKAAFGVPEMETAWHSWHRFINDAKASITRTGSRCLMIDIHGHTHVEGWVELGYTLTPDALNNQKYTSEDTSISGLIKYKEDRGEERVKDMIHGEKSLGGLIQGEGYKAVPSPDHPAPGVGNYYTGGHNTVSHHTDLVDTIQLENPKSVRTAKTAPDYAAAVARALTTFLELHYPHR